MKPTMRIAAGLCVLAVLAGCSSISYRRGFVADEALVASIQPGVDNRRSVEGTLGRPTLTSEYGEPVWYYVSSTTEQKPFTTPKIARHAVLAVRFDEAGNVVSAERQGMESVAMIDPESDHTPTLGRERSFLEDLFGNIGQVGTGGGGAGAGS